MSYTNKFIPAKTYHITARLRKETFANFHAFYHTGSRDDSFAIFLQNIIDKHKLLVGEAFTEFRSPMTNEGFYFKTGVLPKCKNVSGKPCLLRDILDYDVYMKLKIQPYDFVTTLGNRVAGVSITAMEVTAKHDLS